MLAFIGEESLNEFLYSVRMRIREHGSDPHWERLIQKYPKIRKIEGTKLVQLFDNERLEGVMGIAFNFLLNFDYVESEYISILYTKKGVEILRKQREPEKTEEKKPTATSKKSVGQDLETDLLSKSRDLEDLYTEPEDEEKKSSKSSINQKK